jgi:AraC-like DNA-binding protein
VLRYWEFRVQEGAPAEHRVPPDGCTSLLVASGPRRFPMLIASGPWLEPLTIPVWPADRFVGVRLQPGAAAPFLGVDPVTRSNTAAPQPTLFGQPTGSLAAALAGAPTLAAAASVMDAAFLEVVPRLDPPDPLVGRVVAALVQSRGAGRIAAIAAELAVSPRTLLRRFRAATGITPKQYARVVRFRLAAMELLDDPVRLSQVAAVGGYADQPHLTREWARLLGVTPGQLVELVRLTVHQDLMP